MNLSFYNLCLSTILFHLVLPGNLNAFSPNPDSSDNGTPAGSPVIHTDLYETDSSYLWPTDASPYASSSFGETRSAHFHAALDIKTWGRKGYKVFATRDGVLARVGIYAKGYGNVVYLRHNDGTYSIYAHLEDFVPRIRRYVDSLRLSDFQFELNHILDQKIFRFKKGDVIGYSGATGVGPPHLHFELRTSRNHPFNPLLTNLTIPDSRPPRFEGLAIEPLSADALVEGKKEIHIQKPQFRSGSYHFGSVDIQGTVGIAVNAFDLADRVSNAYAVYDLKLLHNGNVLFHSRVDSFSYEHSRQLFLDRVYPILQTTKLGYQRLYITDGNTLPFYLNSSEKYGKLRLPPGKHTLAIVAADYYGNRREAKITLNVEPITADSLQFGGPPFQQPPADFNTSLSHRKLDRWIWSKNWIAYPADPQPFIYYTTSNHEFNRLFHDHTILQAGSHQVIPLRHDKNILAFSSDRGVTLHRVIPGQKRRVSDHDSRVYADFYPKSLYDTLSVALVSESTIDSVLASVHVYPKNQPVRNRYRLSYQKRIRNSSISPEKWAFYRKQTRKKGLNHIPTQYNGKHFSADVEHFGTFRLLPDTTTPTITDPQLYRKKNGQWLASVRIRDNLSGVAYTEAKMYINGQRGIPRYDPEDKRLIFYHPEFKPEPINKLRVILPDKVDNRRTEVFQLRR